MTDLLSRPERRTLLKAVRTAFPHATFPDGPYERCAERSRRRRATIRFLAQLLTRACRPRRASAPASPTSTRPTAARVLRGIDRHRRSSAGRRERRHHALQRPRGVGAARLGGRVVRSGRLRRARLRRPRLAAGGAGREPEAAQATIDPERPLRQRRRGRGRGRRLGRRRRHARQRALPAGRQGRGARGRPAPDRRRLRPGRVGGVQPDGVAGRRTTSGSWRVATDFPNLPAWTVKAVGGTTTHWAGACPRFKEYEFKARTTYGDVDGAKLLDWPITLADSSPTTTRPRSRSASPIATAARRCRRTTTTGVRQRRREVGYDGYATGPYGTNAEPYDGRPGSVQDGFNFQGDKQGSKWSTLVAELPKAEATGKLDLRPGSHVVADHARCGRQGRRGPLRRRRRQPRRQAARAVCVAGNAIETARLLLLSASPSHPDGLANSCGQVGRNYMRHVTASVYARFDKPVRMYRGETMAGVIADEAAHDTDRGFAGGYYMETLSLGPAFLAAFVDPGAGARSSPRPWTPTRTPPACGSSARTCRRPTNRVTLNPTCPTSTASRCPTSTSTTTPTTSRCATTRGRTGRRSTTRSARRGAHARRRIRRRTTSGPAG